MIPAFAIPLAGGAKADANVLRLMPRARTYGALCIAVVHGGWLDWPEAGDLWEAYGELADPAVACTDLNSEMALYSHVAHRARLAMSVGKNKCRAGTDYRVASAVIQDVSGATWRPCCKASRCPMCNGVGWIEPSNTTRAAACRTRFPEYVRRLRPVFEVVRSGIEEEFRLGKVEYAKARARLHAPRDRDLLSRVSA